ncbi:hypothetical protein XAUB_05490 [Xanthomonas citri pv. aurantifolii str. ICPB 11122]|nr:hypothetical protein XAUB_05490 [Xanthomonas citri pv. aurantifolii str. ICPB 11122]
MPSKFLTSKKAACRHCPTLPDSNSITLPDALPCAGSPTPLTSCYRALTTFCSGSPTEVHLLFLSTGRQPIASGILAWAAASIPTRTSFANTEQASFYRQAESSTKPSSKWGAPQTRASSSGASPSFCNRNSLKPDLRWPIMEIANEHMRKFI